MNEPPEDQLMTRLEGLERENRRIKCIGGAALFGIVALLVMGQSKPDQIAKVIDAERFVVRDTSGAVRAVLGVNPDGNMGLEVRDRNGKAGVTLGMGANGNPALRLDGKDGKTGIALGVRSDNSSAMEFYNNEGKIVWAAPQN
jgi:hypothetical protein